MQKWRFGAEKGIFSGKKTIGESSVVRKTMQILPFKVPKQCNAGIFWGLKMAVLPQNTVLSTGWEIGEQMGGSKRDSKNGIFGGKMGVGIHVLPTHPDGAPPPSMQTNALIYLIPSPFR